MSHCSQNPSENTNGNGHYESAAGNGFMAASADTPTLRTRPKKLAAALGPHDKQLPSTGETSLSALHRAGPPTDLLSPPPTPTNLLRLKVVRGLKVNAEYPIYDGENLIGRGDDKPVDIDLRDQEPRDHVWASRHHATVHLIDGVITVEDLNSLNGTYVNRHRVRPGEKRTLHVNDILQVGTIQMKITV